MSALPLNGTLISERPCFLIKMILKKHLAVEVWVSIYIFLEITTSDPSIYTMDHPDFILCNFMRNFIDTKWVKKVLLGKG